jgi:transcriptional regulator with XRE-family HTH domain
MAISTNVRRIMAKFRRYRPNYPLLWPDHLDFGSRACDPVAMDDDLQFLIRQDPAQVGSLLLRTGITLGMHHRELASVLGVSRRTVSRWASEGTFLSREHIVVLANLAHARDPSLAAEIAALAHETLVTLGLESPAAVERQTPTASTARLVDAVVCAAAEAMNASPRAARLALAAALRATREMGLSLETVEAILTTSIAPSA